MFNVLQVQLTSVWSLIRRGNKEHQTCSCLSKLSICSLDVHQLWMNVRSGMLHGYLLDWQPQSHYTSFNSFIQINCYCSWLVLRDQQLKQSKGSSETIKTINKSFDDFMNNLQLSSSIVSKYSRQLFAVVLEVVCLFVVITIIIERLSWLV